MPRFAAMLKSAYEARGHSVVQWSPPARLYRRFANSKFAKWAGYFDQYVLFPQFLRKALKSTDSDTLFVFCDQALGPWVPLVRHRPHVVHVHDLLALRSALGDIKENPTAISGRIYQRFIRRGFRQGKHFISVSKKTRDDLHRFGRVDALSSDVVYNGLNFPFQPMPLEQAQRTLREAGLPLSPKGFLLHVGGHQWYKNPLGVVAIYARYVAQQVDPLPLWWIGPKPNDVMRSALAKIGSAGDVQFFQNVSAAALQAAYCCAAAFLFPSIAEGFGWPLVEALACGSPVITTDEPPMNEIAGDTAFYLPRLQFGEDINAWAEQGAAILQKLVAEPAAVRQDRSERGRGWVKIFDTDRCLDAYLAIYSSIMKSYPRGAERGLELEEGRWP
jgi:glycosyltransferase involved in cell wall biosynthesis